MNSPNACDTVTNGQGSPGTERRLAKPSCVSSPQSQFKGLQMVETERRPVQELNPPQLRGEKVLENLQHCLDFSQDDTCDSAVLIRLFEQSVNFATNLDPRHVSSQAMCEYVDSLLTYLKDKQPSQQSHPEFVQQVRCHLHEYFEKKQNQLSTDECSNGKDNQPQSAGVKYFMLQNQPITSVTARKSSAAGSIHVEEVNEILIQMEMKKFQQILLS